MMDDLEGKARSKALEDLMRAMGDDDMKRKPDLIISITAGGKAGMEGDPLEEVGESPAFEAQEDALGGGPESFDEMARRRRGY